MAKGAFSIRSLFGEFLLLGKYLPFSNKISFIFPIFFYLHFITTHLDPYFYDSAYHLKKKKKKL